MWRLWGLNISFILKEANFNRRCSTHVRNLLLAVPQLVLDLFVTTGRPLSLQYVKQNRILLKRCQNFSGAFFSPLNLASMTDMSWGLQTLLTPLWMVKDATPSLGSSSGKVVTWICRVCSGLIAYKISYTFNKNLVVPQSCIARDWPASWFWVPASSGVFQRISPAVSSTDLTILNNFK